VPLFRVVNKVLICWGSSGGYPPWPLKMGIKLFRALDLCRFFAIFGTQNFAFKKVLS
jgi:hypothetical protein